MEKKKLRIGIDIDEVLAEHLNQLIKFYEKEKGVLVERDKFFSQYWPDVWKISLDEAINIDEKFKESSFFDNILPIDNSIEIVKNLSENHELFVITSRPIKFKNKTEKWLKFYFGNSFNEIIHSSDFHENNSKKLKSEICCEQNIDIIIEDHEKYSLDCANNGIKVLLIDNPWNKKCVHENIIRVKDWKEIQKKIKELS